MMQNLPPCEGVPEILDSNGLRHGCKRRLDATSSNTAPTNNSPCCHLANAADSNPNQHPMQEGIGGGSRHQQREDEAEFGYTAKHHRRHYVQHNYRDHSDDKDDSEDSRSGSFSSQNAKRFSSGSGGGVSIPFPEKLHILLDKIEEDGFSHVISWQPHGRAFLVHDPKEFCQVIMPRYFRQSKLSSFQRQLNLYGFCRLTRGRDKSAYYHELFLRGRLFLTKQMTRTRIKGTGIKASSSPDTEPNFYLMRPCLPSNTAPTVSPNTISSPEGEWNGSQNQQQQLQQQQQPMQQHPGPVSNMSSLPPLNTTQSTLPWRDIMTNGTQLSIAGQQQQQQLEPQQAQVYTNEQPIQVVERHGVSSTGGPQVVYTLQQVHPMNGDSAPNQQNNHWVQVQTVHNPLIHQQQSPSSNQQQPQAQQQQQQQVVYTLPAQNQMQVPPQQQTNCTGASNTSSGHQNATWPVVSTASAVPVHNPPPPPTSTLPLHQEAASLFSALQTQSSHAMATSHLSPITTRLLDPALLQRFQQPQNEPNEVALAAAAVATATEPPCSSSEPAKAPQQLSRLGCPQVSDSTIGGGSCDHKLDLDSTVASWRDESLDHTSKSPPLPSDEKEVECLFNIEDDMPRIESSEELAESEESQFQSEKQSLHSRQSSHLVISSSEVAPGSRGPIDDRPRAESPASLSDATPPEPEFDNDDEDPAGFVEMDDGFVGDTNVIPHRQRNEHNMAVTLRRLSLVSLGSDISDGEAERRDAQAMDDFFAEFEDAETKALVDMIAEHDTDEVLGDVLDQMIDSL